MDASGELGRRSPQHLRWGDGPCIRPPNIWRSTVIIDEAKYVLSEKRCQGGIRCSEVEVFGQEKGHISYNYVRFQKVETDNRLTK